MSRRHLIMLAALAALWGSSFMFIELALRDLAPATVILIRIASGALALAVYLRLAGHRLASLRPYAAPLALLGLVNTAAPFFLIAWGQQSIDSGLAAILNASAPLFTALFALPLDRSQRVTGLRFAGVLLGFAGVVLLVGFELRRRRPRGRGRARGRGCLRLLRDRRPLRRPPFQRLPFALVAFGSLAWATLFTLPLGAAQAELPGWTLSSPCSTSASPPPGRPTSSTSD